MQILLNSFVFHNTLARLSALYWCNFEPKDDTGHFALKIYMHINWTLLIQLIAKLSDKCRKKCKLTSAINDDRKGKAGCNGSLFSFPAETFPNGKFSRDRRRNILLFALKDVSGIVCNPTCDIDQCTPHTCAQIGISRVRLA